MDRGVTSRSRKDSKTAVSSKAHPSMQAEDLKHTAQLAGSITGWRMSPPGRRVSPPGWRVSSPGRRVSPSGWRVSSPDRRVSLPGRRVSPPGSSTGWRVSPPGS